MKNQTKTNRMKMLLAALACTTALSGAFAAGWDDLTPEQRQKIEDMRDKNNTFVLSPRSLLPLFAEKGKVEFILGRAVDADEFSSIWEKISKQQKDIAQLKNRALKTYNSIQELKNSNIVTYNDLKNKAQLKDLVAGNADQNNPFKVAEAKSRIEYYLKARITPELAVAVLKDIGAKPTQGMQDYLAAFAAKADADPKSSEKPEEKKSSEKSEDPKSSEKPEDPKSSEEPKPEEPKPEEPKPEEPKPEEKKPSEDPKSSEKPEEKKSSEEPKPEEPKPSEEPKPEEPKPEEKKPSEEPKPEYPSFYKESSRENPYSSAGKSQQQQSQSQQQKSQGGAPKAKTPQERLEELRRQQSQGQQPQPQQPQGGAPKAKTPQERLEELRKQQSKK